MEKKNKIILISLIILTILVVGLCIYSLINKKDTILSDAEKFRSEYMNLNDKVNEDNQKSYINVIISETNTVKYASEEDVINILKDGTGVIYFGFSKCPWCRSLVPSLTKVAEELNETIYYLDILDIRSSFEISEEKLNKIKDGSKNYYEILKLLDNELEEFYLEDTSGNKYDTLEKRLYAPTLVAIKDGEVTSFHVGTVDTQESGYDKLTDDETKELEKTITDLIESKNIEICTKDKC